MKTPHQKYSTQAGSALITLLAFMAAAILVTTGAVSVIVINEQSSLKYSLAEETIAIAEAGAENGVMRVLRDPNYVGETLQVGNGSAVITVTGQGTNTRTILSDATRNGFRRRVQVVGSYVNAVFTTTTWNEVD